MLIHKSLFQTNLQEKYFMNNGERTFPVILEKLLNTQSSVPSIMKLFDVSAKLYSKT